MRKIIKGNTQPGLDMRGYRRARPGDGWLVFGVVVGLFAFLRFVVF